MPLSTRLKPTSAKQTGNDFKSTLKLTIQEYLTLTKTAVLSLLLLLSVPEFFHYRSKRKRPGMTPVLSPSKKEATTGGARYPVVHQVWRLVLIPKKWKVLLLTPKYDPVGS